MKWIITGGAGFIGCHAAARFHRAGHRVVLVSRATRAEVDPLADELGADDVVATRVSVTDGRIDGIGSPVCAGPQAAGAVSAWADDHDVVLAASFA